MRCVRRRRPSAGRAVRRDICERLSGTWDVGWNGGVRVCSLVYVFFSSRRRHTRCSRDWSSDVCSSDLKSVRNCPRAQGPPGLVIQCDARSETTGTFSEAATKQSAPRCPESPRAHEAISRETPALTPPRRSAHIGWSPLKLVLYQPYIDSGLLLAVSKSPRAKAASQE